MKFQTKMLTFSGAALLAVVLFILVLTGWNIAKLTEINHGKIKGYATEQLKNAAFAEISAKASTLEADFSLRMNLLNAALIQMESRTPAGRPPHPPEEFVPGDPVFFGKTAGREFLLTPPKGKLAGTLPEELKKAAAGSKAKIEGMIVLPQKGTGRLWLLQIRRRKNEFFAAACEIDLRKKLSEICTAQGLSRLVLIAGKREIGSREEFRSPKDISSRLRIGMASLGSRFSFPHVSRIANAETVWNERTGKRKGEPWIAAAAGVRTPVFASAQLCLVQAVPYPRALISAEAFPFAKFMFAETLIVLAGALLLFLILGIMTRQTAVSLKRLLHKAHKITRGDLPGIDCTDSTFELNGLSGALNHLSDKLSGMRMRLQKSHEREMLAKKDAEESSRTKALLLNELISDLAEPLNLISGFSGLLLRTADANPETHEVLRKISEENRSVNRKIQSLKGLALLDTDDAEPVFSEFDTDELISTLRSAARESASEKHIQIESHSSEISGKIISDKSILNTILFLAADSILLNAEPRSRLIIAVQEQGREIEIRISDTPKTNRVSPAQVFSEYRTSPETAYVPPGCGTALLNLEVLSSKAKLLGASFEASVSRTENSIFTIRFLRDGRLGAEGRGTAQKREYNSTASAHSSITMFMRKPRKIYLSEGREPSILVADSSASAVTMFSMMLEHEHYKTDSASSPDEVLTKLRNRHYDLLLLDLNLQRGLCLELLHTIRTEISDSIVIITLSPELTPAEKKDLRDAGAERCLLKPVRMDELADAIRELTVS